LTTITEIRTKEDESSEDEEFWNMDMFKEKPEDNDQEYQYEKPGHLTNRKTEKMN